MDNLQIAIMIVAVVAVWALKENSDRKREVAAQRRELHYMAAEQTMRINVLERKVQIAHERLDAFRESSYIRGRR